MREFNAAVQPGTFNGRAGRLPHRGTETAEDPLGADHRYAAFLAYPLRPGITFTYLGVKVDEKARVLMQTASPCTNLFAAGEIMAGNILGQGYLAGIGMTIGAVFGRIAGREAAHHAGY